MSCSYPGVPTGVLYYEKGCVLQNFCRFFGQLPKCVKESNVEFFVLLEVVHCNKIKYDTN